MILMMVTTSKMPKKHRKNNRSKVSLNNIIKRLPLHRQLNDSQSAVIDFSETWQKWASANLPSSFEGLATITSFDDGLLTIGCHTPTAASQLKHLQVSLLEAFQTAGFEQIQRLKININHTHDFLDDSENANNKSPQTHGTTLFSDRKQNLKTETLTGIKNCSKAVKNERLMASLEKLASTLEEDQRTRKKED